MTIQTQEFWKTTPLNAINKLMDQTFSYAQEGGDLAEMYMDDLRDFKKAVGLFRNSDSEGLAKHVDEMDTASREQLVTAFASDCGQDFVSAQLGYKIIA